MNLPDDSLEQLKSTLGRFKPKARPPVSNDMMPHDVEDLFETDVGEPEAGFGQPQTGVGQPQPGFGQPQTRVGQPQTSLEKPQTSYKQPKTSAKQPQTGFRPPQTSGNQSLPIIGRLDKRPQTNDKQPQTNDKQPQTGVRPTQTKDTYQPQANNGKPQTPQEQEDTTTTGLPKKIGTDMKSDDLAMDDKGEEHSDDKDDSKPLLGSPDEEKTDDVDDDVDDDDDEEEWEKTEELSRPHFQNVPPVTRPTPDKKPVSPPQPVADQPLDKALPPSLHKSTHPPLKDAHSRPHAPHPVVKCK